MGLKVLFRLPGLKLQTDLIPGVFGIDLVSSWLIREREVDR